MKGFLLITTLSLVLSVMDAQVINTACTSSMITSFTPCFNFFTGSTSNGSSTPTTQCCSSLKSMMSNSMDCACLIVTANVPIQLPINRTLALSLPRACNMDGVPLQCKSTGTPLPAPGSVSLGPSPAPEADAPDSAFSPRASKAVSSSPGPESGSSNEALSPSALLAPSAETPNANPRIRPVMNPSSSGATSHITLLPFTVLISIAAMVLYLFMNISLKYLDTDG
ncbi:non-specific lipid transfer protein GPI-anchored 16-like [Rutidosis leptorrhynchoides]|uniref:non-specific lipid transfer protein GPI-anchored 16-like n=1 Tax=Rutidosis leptorrhynchoides TaxID=125765 RepID=UPI003A998C76